MPENNNFDNDITIDTNTPLYIAKSEVGSAPLTPERDSSLLMEMSADPRIVDRFTELASTFKEAIGSMSPEVDEQILAGLLDSNVSHDTAGELIHRLEMSITENGKKYQKMIGFVTLYRSYPPRIVRYVKEGLLDAAIYEETKLPVLELSYARTQDAPSGVIVKGVQAELYRLYDIAVNHYSDVEMVETNYTTETEIPDSMSYNNICPVRVTATIDRDNFGSMKLAEKLGFVNKGLSRFETVDEAVDPDKVDQKVDYLFELDWDKFMETIDHRVWEGIKQISNE
jgi:hypothetical protein